MSSDLTLDIGNCHQYSAMDSEAGSISIDQGGEWDLGLFDEDTFELLEAIQNPDYVDQNAFMEFVANIPFSDENDVSSTSTDGEANVRSLSPAYTHSSALSPYSLHDEALSPQSQLSPLSVSSDSSGFSEIPPKKVSKRSTQGGHTAPPVKKPFHTGSKVSIQPKPLITALALPPSTKTIIIQPIQTAVIPVVKPGPVNIKPARPKGPPIVLPHPSQLPQAQIPKVTAGDVVSTPKPYEDILDLVGTSSLLTPSSENDSNVSLRRQRMMKNRESASLSRKKKKDYLLSLEARLKVALSENEVLKCENGDLKRQLEGLLSENIVLKTKSPKRKAVCLLVIMVFLVLNIGPIGLLQSVSKLDVTSTQHSGRHLLGFSQEPENELIMDSQVSRSSSEMTDSSKDKALMVVKDPVFLRPPSPCQPINRTKCIELAHELRGWVHRHEVQQTKSRRTNNSNHKNVRTILASHRKIDPKMENKESGSAQVVAVPYTDETVKKNQSSELQVYYAPTYTDFLDELNRRGDTFYVVSFRRDHLLLPATNHNKGSRPKMSVVLPAMNINEPGIISNQELTIPLKLSGTFPYGPTDHDTKFDSFMKEALLKESIIRGEKFEVMMQIDCEVTDTRILHIRSSSIPPLLRVNHTDTFYQHKPTNDNNSTPPVGVLMGSS